MLKRGETEVIRRLVRSELSVLADNSTEMILGEESQQRFNLSADDPHTTLWKRHRRLLG
jgi:hypothetical protein